MTRDERTAAVRERFGIPAGDRLPMWVDLLCQTIHDRDDEIRRLRADADGYLQANGQMHRDLVRALNEIDALRNELREARS